MLRAVRGNSVGVVGADVLGADVLGAGAGAPGDLRRRAAKSKRREKIPRQASGNSFPPVAYPVNHR